MQAAELFEVENQGSEANKCRLKIAQFSAELERFPVAIEIYESIAKTQVDNNLLKFSAKGNLLNAGLCRLNGKSGSAAEGVAEGGGGQVGEDCSLGWLVSNARLSYKAKAQGCRH